MARSISGATPFGKLNLFRSVVPVQTQPSSHCRQMSAMVQKPLENSIRDKLSTTFQPKVLDVVNESYMHNVPKGSETHFKVVVVSDAFEGVSLVERHRKINTLLQEEFSKGLHALSIVAKTSSQWEKSSQKVDPSPPCRGGAGL